MRFETHLLIFLLTFFIECSGAISMKFGTCINDIMLSLTPYLAPFGPPGFGNMHFQIGVPFS